MTMNIYAVKDRLLNYFMQPFAGPGDKEVLAAISAQVNSGDITGIGAAPHHYEIWRLGAVNDDGHITPDRIFIGDASALVRTGNRKLPGEEAGKGEGKDT